MGRALVACCLAALAVTAGCSGPAAETHSTTLTPADPPDPLAGTLAPGLAETGVVDPVALADAHADALADRSFAVAFNRTRYYNGRVVRNREVSARVDPPGRYRARTDEDSVYSTHRRQWLLATPNRTRLVVSLGDGPPRNETVTGDPLAAVGIDPDRRGRIAGLLDLASVEGVDPRRPGADAYRLSGTAVRNRSALVYDRDRLLDVRFEASVGASGLVRSYTWRYSLIRGRTNVTVVERYRVGDVGRTTVDPDATLPRSGG